MEHQDINPDLNIEVDTERRFGGIARLYGEAGLARLQAAHVCVIGIGGVGSWAAEALARSGVGAITLIDLDHVAESNINRQIHAADATLGMAKIEAMARRIHGYAPDCKLTLIDDFLDEENVGLILPACDGIIDAMNANDEVYGRRRLREFLTGADGSVKEIAGGLLRNIEEFTADQSGQTDDISLVCFQRLKSGR